VTSVSINELHAARDAFFYAYRPDLTHSGRGIVTTAYDGEFASSWVQLCELKRLGVTLPVEVFHCPGELSPEQITLLEGIGLNLRVRYLREGQDGYASKVYAVLASSFAEVLWIDSDNIPVRNPEFLFDDPEYQTKGSLFWRDVSGVDRFQWGPDQGVWQVFGVPFNDGEEFETGQFLVNKNLCWKQLGLVLHYAEEQEVYYTVVHGDKDTFRMAWLIGEQLMGRGVPYGGNFLQHSEVVPYGFMPFGPFHIGAPNPWHKWGGGSVMQQRDRDGRALFNHRSIDKFTLRPRDGDAHLRENDRSWMTYGPAEEQLYLQHLGRLRSLLSASRQRNAEQPSEPSSAVSLQSSPSSQPSPLAPSSSGGGLPEIVWLPRVL
jgi:hypothetical protein